MNYENYPLVTEVIKSYITKLATENINSPVCLKVLLPEGRADEAWEPANEITLILLPK